MSTIKEKYESECNRHSDINEHLSTLKNYSDECDHITEMGVRNIVSTWAFLMGNPKKLISYDINQINESIIKDLLIDTNIEFNFILGDTTKIEIEETDLLFIDTLHNYEQLKIELELHGNKSKKYIILHDTTLFGERNETNQGIGLNPAINKFIEKNPHWVKHEVYTNCCGLTILKRN
jgi:hypothetical protein